MKTQFSPVIVDVVVQVEDPKVEWNSSYQRVRLLVPAPTAKCRCRYLKNLLGRCLGDPSRRITAVCSDWRGYYKFYSLDSADDMCSRKFLDMHKMLIPIHYMESEHSVDLETAESQVSYALWLGPDGRPLSPRSPYYALPGEEPEDVDKVSHRCEIDEVQAQLQLRDASESLVPDVKATLDTLADANKIPRCMFCSAPLIDSTTCKGCGAVHWSPTRDVVHAKSPETSVVFESVKTPPAQQADEG